MKREGGGRGQRRDREPRHRQDRTCDNMGETGCLFFFCLCMIACVRKGRTQVGWRPGVWCCMLAAVQLNVQDVQSSRDEAEAVESERRQCGGCQLQEQPSLFSPGCIIRKL